MSAANPATMVNRPKDVSCVDAMAAVPRTTIAIVRRDSASARNATVAISAINVKCVFIAMAHRRAK